MHDAEMKCFIETAHLLSDAAGSILRRAWMEHGGASLKEDGSPVTETDLAVEEALRSIIKIRHPDHAIYGEEFGQHLSSGNFTWVIDPIDGTRQFAARLANFGVLIALCKNEEPVLGVIEQPLIHARCVAAQGRGTFFNGARVRCRSGQSLDDAVISLANPKSFPDSRRRAFDDLSGRGAISVYDGGCLSYVSLARGMVDVCLNGPDLEPFDICALVPIVEEAGGVITAWDGRRPNLTYAGAICASGSADLHIKILAVTSPGTAGI